LKFASGAEASSSSSRLGRRPIPNEFVVKITKAFLDATYAFLDGLVRLAEEGSPVVEKIPGVDVNTTGELQAMTLLDTSDVVSFICPWMSSHAHPVRTHAHSSSSPIS
jgi:exocyst complex component 2